MKGGRTAPRNCDVGTLAAADSRASMKGGRTAPRNWADVAPLGYCPTRFNEGGADCPPKHRYNANKTTSTTSLQ